MNISCEELFGIFVKIGGKFKVDYIKNEGTLYPQNIKCKNMKIESLTNFMYDISPFYYIFVKEIPNNIIGSNNKIINIHRNQTEGMKEIHIEFRRNKNGEMDIYRRNKNGEMDI